MPVLERLQETTVNPDQGISTVVSVSVMAYAKISGNVGSVVATTTTAYRHLATPVHAGVPDVPPSTKVLEGEEYPALVRIWDNDDDAIYDQV
jgi:hypothetical protein